MSDRGKKIYLWIATTITVVAFLFWERIFIMTGGDLIKYQGEPYQGGGFDIFWIGVALNFFALSFYIFMVEKFTISFLMFLLSLANLIDDLYLDNYELSNKEVWMSCLIMLITIAYEIRKRKQLRKNRNM